MDNILEVKNLKISFRTNGGTVKAVRDISFNLKRGETLAIVGESGSGKSVTSKAILGILAGNSIVEGGEILFDGKDLLNTPEEDMCSIRGDKISMIFQDPLSSLDPIVKIGKQITEAMLLKNKAARKASRKEFNDMLSLLKGNMIATAGKESENSVSAMISTFDKFNIEAVNLERSYNTASNKASELIADIEEFLFLAEKKQKINVKEKLSDFAKTLTFIKDIFFTAGSDEAIADFRTKLTGLRSSYHSKTDEVSAEITGVLSEGKELLVQLKERTKPNFFRIGYYKFKNPSADLTTSSIEDLNRETLTYLDENFMEEFILHTVDALKASAEKSLEYKKQALTLIPEIRRYFSDGNFTKKEAKEKCKALISAVENSIDKMDFIKDSTSYTFASSIYGAVDKYFYYQKNNPKEESRFARQSARRQKLIDRGKTVDWKVRPKVVLDLEELIGNIVRILDRLETKFNGDLQGAPSVDYHAKAIALIDFLKEKASLFVNHLTKKMAKEKAIKIMEEVGIPEPRIRYNQYPFEFSGGMRQRIVIAIALSANPDILICDEPTTALDVTIQAQILELINNLKKERNLSVIFITHDLGVVANMADKIAVMYAGKIVEYGDVDDVFYDPRHPYTWALLSSMPDLDTDEKLEAIPGTPPNMIYPPEGDAFAARNKYALKIDFEQQPPMFEVSPTHWAATWLLHPNAPKVDPPQIIVDRIERMKKLGGAENGEA